MILGLLIWLALLTAGVGLAWRVVEYARTQQPHHIPLTPAPRSSAGVAVRMAKEILLFASLYRADRWLWILVWPFHLGLVVLFLHHGQYFGLPVLTALVGSWSVYAGWVVLVTAIGLLLRRLLLERVRYISTPSDYLMLVLFMVITGLGLAMALGMMPDLGALHLYLSGVWRLDFAPFQTHGVLATHVVGAILLLLILPFSKLLHAPAVFFSPTLNQAER